MKVKLEETADRRRLHIGSVFVDLNETDYRELVKIFASPLQTKIEELEAVNKGLEQEVKRKDLTLAECTIAIKERNEFERGLIALEPRLFEVTQDRQRIALLVNERNEQLQAANEVIKELERRIELVLPEDCVLDYTEVKFCSHRLGEGNMCRNCINSRV